MHQSSRYSVGHCLALLAVFAVVASVVTGCGSSSGGPPAAGERGPLLRALDVGPYPGTGQYYRYRDMLDHVYTASPGDGSYNGWYESPAEVTYELTDGTTLMGSINAVGLKPHFAYQVKLEGMPTAAYPWDETDLADPLNSANKQIGSVGRWWCVTDGWNVSDSQLASGAHDGHTVLGYLLFDFFMTDIDGNATQELYLDSSFHVVWRTDQRRANRVRDGTPRPHGVTYRSDVYSSSFSPQDINVYAEGERGRPKPGQVALPAGYYECRLLITEESFHNVPPALQSQYPWGQTNYADGGFWAHALSDDAFAFTILGGGSSSGQMHVGDITMGLQTKGPFTNATATVSVVDTSGLPVEGVSVSGSWSGVVSGSASSVTDSSGEATVKSAKTRSSGTFTFTVADLSKDGWTYDADANVETWDSISN